MVRLKQEWKAQMRNKQATQHSRPHAVHEQLHYQQQSPPPAPPAVSANCIDLTIDDDSEDDDEPLVSLSCPQAHRSPQRSNTTTSSAAVESSVLSMESAHGNDNSNGQIFEGEPVESDVDEEWPQPAPVVQPVVRAPMCQLSSLSFSEDEDQESEEDEELPRRMNGSPMKRATRTSLGDEGRVTGSEQAARERSPSQDRAEGQRVVSVINIDDAEDGITSASPANSDASQEDDHNADVTSEPAAKKLDAIDDEYLEDGEIFEEGAVPASPTKVKQAIALERLASRAMGNSPQQQQRQKKQKKRGKKKSKRKLDAMLMMGGGGAAMATGFEVEFERNTRHHSFLPPTATLDQHMAEVDSMMMMYGGGPASHAAGNAASYGAHGPPMPPPPAHPHMHANPRMPSGPPPPPPSSSGAFPAFADDQILRVNRHGNVEMFNSNGEFSRNGPKPPPLPPQPPVALGGFNYRNIQPQPPRFAVPAAAESNGSSKGGSSSSSSSSSSQSPEKLLAEGAAKASPSADFDLDSLRAAALRTKRLSKVVADGEVSVDVADNGAKKGSPPLPVVPPLPASEPVGRKSDVPEPSIDDLRAEILRSMMMKKKAARPATVNASSTVKPQPVKIESAPTKVSSPVSVDQQQQQEQQPVIQTESNLLASEEKKETQPRPSVYEPLTAPANLNAPRPSPSPSPPLPPTHVDYSSLSVSTAAVVPLKCRPLTASSQSIVIRLSREDYVKSSKSGESGSGGACGNTGSSTIQSAIDEMRKKIAEKEKLRNESRSVIVCEDNQKSAVVKNGDTVIAEKKIAVDTQQQQRSPSRQADNVASAETTTKNPETMSSLQARIDAMKKQIAAKEMKKSNGVSSTSSSTRASASSSPLSLVKYPAATNGVSTACVPTSTKARGAPAAAAGNRAHSIRTSKDTLAVPSVST